MLSFFIHIKSFNYEIFVIFMPDSNIEHQHALTQTHTYAYSNLPHQPFLVDSPKVGDQEIRLVKTVSKNNGLNPGQQNF